MPIVSYDEHPYLVLGLWRFLDRGYSISDKVKMIGCRVAYAAPLRTYISREIRLSSMKRATE